MCRVETHERMKFGGKPSPGADIALEKGTVNVIHAVSFILLQWRQQDLHDGSEANRSDHGTVISIR